MAKTSYDTLRTNNQPAPDDGLAGKVADEIARRGPDILRGHNRADLRAILSALTAKDHTALLGNIRSDAAEIVETTLCKGARILAERTLTRIDQALATEGDGE